MKKFLISLFCKKSALVITTICASATIATTAVVIPNCLSNRDEKLEDVVVVESTKQLQNKMNTENKEESYTEDEVTTLETASNEDKQIGVILDSQKSSQSYESSETKNLANEKEQETTEPKQQTQVAPTTPKAEEQKEPEKQVPAVSSKTEVKEEKEPETTEPKEQASVASATPKVEEDPKTTETKKEEPKASETPEAEEKQEAEVTKPEEKTPTTSTAPKAEEEKEPEATEPKEQTPVVSEAKENQEQKETETKKEETPKAPATQEVEQQKSESEEVESEKQTPTVSNKSETETKEPEATPSTSKPEEEAQQNEELITRIQKAVEKTKNADSAYLTKYRTSIYPENSKIKYNKSQNRRLYIDGDVEEYLEGFPGRYTTEFNASRYYYQTYWRKNQETNQWEKRGTIHSSFGISELGYFRKIKSVEKLNIERCPFEVYVVTLDKDSANVAGENLLNTPNMFKTDITLTVMIDHEGYIRSIDCNWTKDVLNNPSLGPVIMTIHIGDLNTTKVDKPKDLKEEPVNNQDTRNELTPNKKEIIKSSIYEAYKKTYNANSATYNLNGKKVKYDIKNNSALMENTDGTTTYYKGTDNKYVDHDYVKPEFHQDSWTKAKDSNTWKKNVRKHTCFIPKELYFLNIIFDVKKVEESENMTTYTIEVLKQYANSAYSYSNNTSDNKFNSNITFTVSVDKEGYIREIHIDSEGYKLDLVISDINNTNVERPEALEM